MKTIKRNRAIVGSRMQMEKTYVVKEYLWGLLAHKELLHTKDLGWDLIIQAESKPKNIYLQIGDKKPKRL